MIYQQVAYALCPNSESKAPNYKIALKVVSIGRLTAFYVVFVPMEYIPSEPPPCTYVIVSFCT